MTTEHMIGQALAIDPNPEYEERLRIRKAHEARGEHPALRDGPEHVIIGARQTGKSQIALKWLQDAPDGVDRVLIINRNSTAEHIKRDHGFKLNDPRIISYRQLINQGARSGVEYAVDETVHILSELLGLKELPHLVTVAHAEDWQG